MKATSACAIALFSAGCAAQAVQPAHDARRLTIEQLIDIKHPSNPMWSPDGRLVAFVWDRAGVSKVYVASAENVNTQSPSPRELPDAGASLAGAFWSANGQALMVTKAGVLWRVPLDGSAGAEVWKTPTAETAVTPSPDGTRLAFVRAASTGGSELVVRTLADGRETHVLRSDDHVMNDGQLVAGRQVDRLQRRATARSVTSRRRAYSGSKIIYTISENVPGETASCRRQAARRGPLPVAAAASADADGWTRATSWPTARRPTSRSARRRSWPSPAASRRCCTRKWRRSSGASPATHAGAQPSPDGKWIAFLSDRDGWDHLYVMPRGRRADGRCRSRKGSSRRGAAVVARQHAHRVRRERAGSLRRLGICTSRRSAPIPRARRSPRVTSGRGTNIAPQWSPDGTRLVYQHTDPQNSADLWIVDAKPRRASRSRLSDSMPAAIDRSAFVEPELVHYAGPDGQPVPAWLFVPKNLDRTKKHPAIVWIHGDGVNQNYDGWHVQRNYAVYYSFHQYLLQQGYVVDRARLSRQHRLRPGVARGRLHGRRRQGRQGRVDGRPTT